MSLTLEAIRAKRDTISDIAARWGASDLRVFGSVARGEARPTSDLDVVVRFEPGRSLLDLGGLKADLEDLLGCAVEVVSESGLGPAFREAIRREAVPL